MVVSADVTSTTGLVSLLVLTVLLGMLTEHVAMQGGECRCGVNHGTLLLAGAHGSHARHCCGWLGPHTAGQEQCRVSFRAETLPFVCLPACLPVCLSVCLPFCLSDTPAMLCTMACAMYICKVLYLACTLICVHTCLLAYWQVLVSFLHSSLCLHYMKYW